VPPQNGHHLTVSLQFNAYYGIMTEQMAWDMPLFSYPLKEIHMIFLTFLYGLHQAEAWHSLPAYSVKIQGPMLTMFPLALSSASQIQCFQDLPRLRCFSEFPTFPFFNPYYSKKNAAHVKTCIPKKHVASCPLIHNFKKHSNLRVMSTPDFAKPWFINWGVLLQ
jgi:hypothetical protein